jgi:hypothetical protein
MVKTKGKICKFGTVKEKDCPACKRVKKEKKEKKQFDPYCEVCGGCGYILCDGVADFLEHHVKGKTNCKNEALFISEIKELFKDSL